MARDLYTSEWFKKAKAFVEKTGEPWYILSAKYGLTRPDTVIEPYEKTLNTMPIAERRAWASRVRQQAEVELPPANEIILLAGQRYREFLLEYLEIKAPSVVTPLEGLRIGEQLRWFRQHISGE